MFIDLFQLTTERQLYTLALAITEFDYTCGAPLLPDDHQMNSFLTTRMNISCESPLELPYYSAALGPVDVCAYCGCSGADPKPELKKKFKTVLPLCEGCGDDGKKPVVARPYGRDVSD